MRLKKGPAGEPDPGLYFRVYSYIDPSTRARVWFTVWTEAALELGLVKKNERGEVVLAVPVELFRDE